MAAAGISTLDPVGFKRVNKRTGKGIQADDIVKGIKQDDGDDVNS